MKDDANTHHPFGTFRINFTELRSTSSLLARLREEPMSAVLLERYGSQEGVVLSSALWELMLGMIRGETIHFTLPLHTGGDLPYTRAVYARRAREEDGGISQGRFEVLVDGVPYDLTIAAPDTPPRPDYEQLIWRHHPDVAREVSQRFCFKK